MLKLLAEQLFSPAFCQAAFNVDLSLFNVLFATTGCITSSKQTFYFSFGLFKRKSKRLSVMAKVIEKFLAKKLRQSDPHCYLIYQAYK